MFVKGRSGNPSGRPKVDPEFLQLARDFAPEGMEKLIEIAKTSRDEKIKIEAIKIILDRAYGKAPQEFTGLPEQKNIIQVYYPTSENGNNKTEASSRAAGIIPSYNGG